MRVGVLGGVFNPPHIGHMVCAQEALVALGLDEVALIPVGEAPHREVEADPGGEVRLALCEAAAAPDDRLVTSRLELDRPGPSYTADTLAELARERTGDELVLILGADEAGSLPSWHDPQRVLASATVAAVEREGLRREEIRERVAGLAGAERMEFFAMPRIDVSSTLVRRRVGEGLSIRYLVPDAVAELVSTRGLYRSSNVGDGAERSGATDVSSVSGVADSARRRSARQAPGTIATGAGAS